MNRKEKFKKSLEYGNKSEVFFMQYIQDNHGFNLIRYNNDKRYDIATEKDGSVYIFEVKTDDNGSFTNNFFFEFHNNNLNEASGIIATEAKWYVYILPSSDFIYIWNVKELKEHLLKSKYMIKDGGDDLNAKGWVVSIPNLIFFSGLKVRVIQTDTSSLINKNFKKK